MVRVLLSCVHGGYLWLGKRIDLNIDLIHCITGLSKSGKDPQTHISGKMQKRQKLNSGKLHIKMHIRKQQRLPEGFEMRNHQMQCR